MARSVDDSTSRYVQGGNTETFEARLGWWERRSIPEASDDIEIVLTKKYHRRPSKLAYDAYGDSSLQWLVLQFNKILDPTTEFITGASIKLPTPERVFLDILNNNTGGINPNDDR